MDRSASGFVVESGPKKSNEGPAETAGGPQPGRAGTIPGRWADVDHGVSGSKDSRPQLDKLMKDGRARKLDVVIVARFDRFARSTRHLILALEEFQSLGVDFISLNERIDTCTAMGKMVFTVLGAVAELERNIIRERVTVGLRRAKKEGKILGRPRVIVDREKVRQLHGQGNSVRIIAAQLGLTRSTVHSIVAG